MKGIHTEEAFEAYIAEHLVAHGGYEHGDPAAYDRVRGMMPALVVGFVQATQAKAWAKLARIHGAGLEGVFLDALGVVLDQRGVLSVLRHGFKFYGAAIRLAYFEPGHGLNPAVWEQYRANRLSVVRQVRYDPHNDNALDLVLCVNGLPVVTAELKNPMTGQRVGDAIRQYQHDRDERAPIFQFKRGALVHFAVDPDEAWMTTRLAGTATRFLPFNRGHGHGAGNPPAASGHRTAYLWEDVWARDNLLDLVGRFIHLQVETGVDADTGADWRDERMVFPRYHQRDAVRRLVGAAVRCGAGTNYLVQHSAGSGKSNTIAWLAHRLASLHDGEDRKVYDNVVVLTDRRVLDQQLQATIDQFEHKEGVVQKIDKDAAQLARALVSGAPIIISTLHKFGFIQNKVAALPERRYAIIVDEAHGSQSGEMALNVKELLADEAAIAQALAEEELAEGPAEAALRAALARGPQANLSFFAFTATPKFKTLELFGHKGTDGKPAPFHLYAMRQAIEEGFILDVLRGYTTYRRFFALAKAVADDPDLDKRKAAAALARFVNLHPTNIAQKTAIIVEHFRSCVRGQLEGQAKAMVVTGSRLSAVRYKQAFDAYVAEHDYRDVHCLVAFSGEVEDDRAPGVRYTEPGLNGGMKESELPQRFASSAYQVLIAANKYQTGFDQPKLVAMYVDKRLAGVQAVQTLSRLNRTYNGKEGTFVLDFVNRREDIVAAFQPYFEATTTAEAVDPQRLYELQHALDGFGVYTGSEVRGFAGVFFGAKADQRPTANARLNGWLDPAVDRFVAIKRTAEARAGSADERKRAVDEAVARQEDFRAKLAAFRNLYGFLGQIVPFRDADLEMLYAFGRMLLRKLPQAETAGPLALDDDVALVSLRVQLEAEGDIELKKWEAGELTGPTATGTGAGVVPRVKLSSLIAVLNERFGTNFDAQDLVDGVAEQLVGDAGLQQAARVNPRDTFKIPFDEALDDALVERHARHAEFINKVFEDDALGAMFRALMLERVYARLTAAPAGVAPAEATAAGVASVVAVMPFSRVPEAEAEPFVNCVPALDLKVAAGGFSAEQLVAGDEGRYDWVTWQGRARPGPGLFIAQVVGESMNRRIPNESWCVWRLNPGSGTAGRVVLAQHRNIQDPELGGTYTVKLYEPETAVSRDGAEHVTRVTLRPDSTDPRFEPLVFEALQDGELSVVAELVEVLG